MNKQHEEYTKFVAEILLEVLKKDAEFTTDSQELIYAKKYLKEKYGYDETNSIITQTSPTKIKCFVIPEVKEIELHVELANE